MRRATRLWTAALMLAAMPALATAQDMGISVGTKAPGAMVETLEGDTVDLADWLKKGPVFLQFWATWCGNCRALEPQVQAAVKKYAGRMQFVSVAVSVNQSVERIKAYRERHGMAQEIVYDRKGYATDAYEVPATSYVVVIDAKGTVVYTGLGSEQDIDAAVRKGLASGS
ncbi:MAG TPA: TlpA disulfide reductase family protein [Gemmatimonadaceae bacterium]